MKKLAIITCAIIFLLYLSSCSHADNFGNQESNSYFYHTDHIMLNATAEYYELETSVENEIEMELYLIKEYEQGGLYKLIMKSIPLNQERTNLYFYVTDEKIYRIWSYIYQENEVVEFYDNDDAIVKFLDTDQKLIENGEVVCQGEEILWEDKEGTKSSISLAENKITYSRIDTRKNGEPGFYEWFVWEQGKGLVEYGSGFGAEEDILYLTNVKVQ